MTRNELYRSASAIAGVSFAFVLLTAMSNADAATITVGPTQYYKTIQAGIGAAHQGDTIAINPGSYGCATINKSNLTLVGTAGGVNVTGTACQSKGLFVVQASNTTVQNITFTGAKVSDGNGAGIRMQGTNLTVLNSVFNTNQDGILTDANTASTLTVKNSSFTHDGACVSSSGCAHGIYAGHIAKLDVENSTFNDTQAGHSIKSRANATVVIGNTIKDGTTGTSSYSIDVPNGGAVTITGNTIQKGAKSTNSMAAIAMGEEGNTNAAGTMLIANNNFQNDLSKTQSFIWNSTGNAALVVSGNVLTGYATTTLKGAGTVSSPTTTMKMSALSNEAAAKANFAAMPANFSSATTDVPEPGTLVLFASVLIGFGLFGGFGKRAKQ